MPRKKRVDSLYHYKLLPDMCKCRQCGEEFEKVSREWAYKLPNGRGGKWYYCTYKCWRKAAQEKPLRGEAYNGR